MDSEAVGSLATTARQYWIPLLFALFGAVLLVVGISSSSNTDSSIQIEQAGGSVASSSAEARIVVDISGAVERPGVYSVPASSRVQDVLIEAGGLGSDANREYIAKNINLASKVSDGAKIYIPNNEENVLVVGAKNATSKVNINTASSGELEKLSGIGVVTANKIIENRPYSSIEELLAKKIVGKKVFDQIKENLTIY